MPSGFIMTSFGRMKHADGINGFARHRYYFSGKEFFRRTVNVSNACSARGSNCGARRLPRQKFFP
jgi:hypothetical protein